MRNGLSILFCVLVITLLVGVARAQVEPTTVPSSQPTTQASFDRAAVIVVDGVIDNYTRTMLFKRFDQAKQQGARTIIIKLNTPGGLVSAALEITRFLRSQDRDDVRTVAFIEGQALSAGAMIAVACDQIVMEPGSFIGDSAPIMMSPQGGLATLGDAERAKAESPIQADFYASASRNGYDPTLLGSMVTANRIVHYVENVETKERRFVEPDVYKKLTEEGWKPVAGVPDPVDRADTLLTVDSTLAEKLGISKGTYATVDAFAAKSTDVAPNGLQIVATFKHTAGEELVGFLGSFAVRGILTTVFMLALWISLSQPGTGLPEAVALACLGVMMGVPMLQGYAQWWEVLAVVLGVVLLAFELFVIPGFGFAGISGIILLFFGLVMSWVGSEPIEIPGVLPSLAGTWTAFQTGLIVVTLSLVLSLVLLWIFRRYLQQTPYFNSLVLQTTVGSTDASPVAQVEAQENAWPYVGMSGEAATELKPGGSAKFVDVDGSTRVLSVVADGAFIARGENVVVKLIEGNRIVVRRKA